ncbi:ABC transporter ATP-binding protein [Paenibacillus yonginensis]|uniref:ABC transporter ATP-binding protein n=1 Tax=Paenibacillus yonginensis TaxID=1462996 RepID=UPI0009F6283B|nr:ABC transporter ATP-binding protein [Paenibacillus yonginensis]
MAVEKQEGKAALDEPGTAGGAAGTTAAGSNTSGTTGPQTVLEVTGLSKTYREGKSAVQVLDNINLTVAEGEFVSIVGPSGSGKSTLFHLIGGLTQPDAGRIALRGREITGERGHIAYVPQQPALFPWRTTLDNVALGLEVAGTPLREARAQTREWLAKAGLAGYEEAYPHMLSGGMQQRAAFLRGLLSPQELMALDEPFSALDALTRSDMQHWLLELWEKNRRSVLFITHSIEEALLLSDRIVLLSGRPARVLHELTVPFPRPRQAEMAEEPEFLRLRREMTELMRSEQRIMQEGKAGS